MSQVTGEDYIELGEEIMDEMSKGLNELDDNDQKPEAPIKKKKKK